MQLGRLNHEPHSVDFLPELPEGVLQKALPEDSNNNLYPESLDMPSFQRARAFVDLVTIQSMNGKPIPILFPIIRSRSIDLLVHGRGPSF